MVAPIFVSVGNERYQKILGCLEKLDRQFGLERLPPTIENGKSSCYLPLHSFIEEGMEEFKTESNGVGLHRPSLERDWRK